MIICFDCSSNTKDILDELIRNGRYKNYTEIINLAVDNLYLLDNTLKTSGGFVIQSNEDDKDQNSLIKTSTTQMHLLSFDTPEKEFIQKRFSLLPKLPSNISVPVIPETKTDKKEFFLIEEWFFGQYNRLFPVKVSCRSIANHQATLQGGVQISEIPIIVAKEALVVAKYLKNIEKVNRLGRDDLLTIALPSVSKDEEKSLLRFASQFVVSKNSSNQLQGVLYDLKFINYTNPSDFEEISLTQAGWDFALLQNPILEDKQNKPTEKLSNEEKEFLIHHINKYVPIERYSYKLIIDGLLKNNNTPELIDIAIQKHFNGLEIDIDNKSFLSTQRSGVISRMIDLNLIERIRKGIRVYFKPTETGIKYFGR